MYRTLSELRDSINQMIESQGEDAACAAFVFTQHDVFEYNEEDNQDQYFPTLFTQDVLADVGGSSYIYEQVGEMIDDAIRLRKQLPLYSNWLWLTVTLSIELSSLLTKRLASLSFSIKHENVDTQVQTKNGILWLILSSKSFSILTSKKHNPGRPCDSHLRLTENPVHH